MGILVTRDTQDTAGYQATPVTQDIVANQDTQVTPVSLDIVAPVSLAIQDSLGTPEAECLGTAGTLGAVCLVTVAVVYQDTLDTLGIADTLEFLVSLGIQECLVTLAIAACLATQVYLATQGLADTLGAVYQGTLVVVYQDIPVTLVIPDIADYQVTAVFPVSA